MRSGGLRIPEFWSVDESRDCVVWGHRKEDPKRGGCYRAASLIPGSKDNVGSGEPAVFLVSFVFTSTGN